MLLSSCHPLVLSLFSTFYFPISVSWVSGLSIEVCFDMIDEDVWSFDSWYVVHLWPAEHGESDLMKGWFDWFYWLIHLCSWWCLDWCTVPAGTLQWALHLVPILNFRQIVPFSSGFSWSVSELGTKKLKEDSKISSPASDLKTTITIDLSSQLYTFSTSLQHFLPHHTWHFLQIQPLTKKQARDFLLI